MKETISRKHLCKISRNKVQRNFAELSSCILRNKKNPTFLLCSVYRRQYREGQNQKKELIIRNGEKLKFIIIDWLVGWRIDCIFFLSEGKNNGTLKKA
jgi:hypothetical protein